MCVYTSTPTKTYVPQYKLLVSHALSTKTYGDDLCTTLTSYNAYTCYYHIAIPSVTELAQEWLQVIHHTIVQYPMVIVQHHRAPPSPPSS